MPNSRNLSFLSKQKFKFFDFFNFFRGSEFTNKKVRDYFKQIGVKIYFPASEQKAAFSERIILNLKRKIFMYLESHQTLKYVDVLQDFTRSLNSRWHRVIKMSPELADQEEFESIVLNNLQKDYDKLRKTKKKIKFKVGQIVRLAKIKNKFSRGYKQSFTDEKFKITKVLTHQPVTMYNVQSISNPDEGEIIGSLYASEMTLATD